MKASFLNIVKYFELRDKRGKEKKEPLDKLSLPLFSFISWLIMNQTLTTTIKLLLRRTRVRPVILFSNTRSSLPFPNSYILPPAFLSLSA